MPGAWSGWELAVRAVLGQQVERRRRAQDGGEARRAARRGRALPDARRRSPTASCPGCRRRAARALRALADGGRGRACGSTRRSTSRPPAPRCSRCPGFGPWTVEYIAMRALRDPDAWPGTRPVAQAAPRRRADAERWRPWRAYAAMVLWQTAASGDAALTAARTTPRHEVAVDDHVAAVGGDDLPVAAAHGRVGVHQRSSTSQDSRTASTARPPTASGRPPSPVRTATARGVASRLTDPMAPASAAARARASRDRRG